MELFKSRTRVAYTNAVGDKVYPVVVDIKKGIKSTEDIQFVSSDVNTGILSVAFISGNENFNVSGADVVCSVMRPDASTLELPCEVVRENIVEVPLGINGTSQDGVYSFDFKVLKGGNKVVGTPIMNYSVSLSIGNDMVVEEDDRLPVLTMLMTQLTELKGEARESINQANTATVASKEATAKAIEATNNATAVSERVSRESSEVIYRVNNKVTEVETRFNALTSSQQQDAEVIDARDGEISLKARLDRDIEKAKQVYVDVEGSHISTDSSVGYLKDVEILGNTIQDASNLADIRSVGDTVEGQELYEIPVVSCGKNLIKFPSNFSKFIPYNGNYSEKILHLEVKEETTYTISGEYFKSNNQDWNSGMEICLFKTLPKNTDSWGLVQDRYTIKFEELAKSVFKYTFTVPQGYKYLAIYFGTATNETYETTHNLKNIQLEKGTQATPYEPYQEDKLTILSPVQLERVGDVADRIICKDGVWGVEKNTGSVVLDGSETYTLDPSVNSEIVNYFFTHLSVNVGQTINGRVILTSHSKFMHNLSEQEHCYVGASSRLYLVTSKSRANSVVEFIELVKANNIIVKYQLEEPQFIPLPHDQQIKLRTFANKTNISFGCEIEGTIKAQVPKSLGATVNTHTEQISNLNKELDRVKKLEESTVSTVTTESDFTTVEATSNGYFEDVKLEGKTLVNLAETTTITLSSASSASRTQSIPCIKKIEKGKVYTLFAKCTNYSLNGVNGVKIGNWGLSGGTINDATICKGVGGVVYKFTVKENATTTLVQVFIDNDNTEGSATLTDFVILEGDHTQNPPSYFEGLKSVGQSATTSEGGADEIEVSSANKNLLNEVEAEGYYRSHANGVLTVNKDFNSVKGRVVPNTRYVLRTGGEISDLISNLCFFDKNFKFISGISNSVFDFTTPMNCCYITIAVHKTHKEVQLELGDTPTKYISPQSDKKRLLYYNDETQAWEKPILRQWDSIEKHADGKYYYHQRSGEVVLNGSENWLKNGILSTDTYIFMHLQNQQIKPTNSMEDFICDKLIPANYYDASSECISKYADGTQIVIKISTSKLSTQDEQGFKQWLQANNVTVVYQLKEEKVYECTNIDLITYANETNYIVESGAIAPKTILKVHNNISNVVKVLQQKVSILENKFIKGLKQVLAGDMYSLAELLYPEDFEEVETENNIMLLPLE